MGKENIQGGGVDFPTPLFFCGAVIQSCRALNFRACIQFSFFPGLHGLKIETGAAELLEMVADTDNDNG